MGPDILRGIPQRVETFRREHPLRPPTKSEMMVGGAVVIALALCVAGAVEFKNALEDPERRPAAQTFATLIAGTALVGAIFSFVEAGSEVIGRIPTHRLPRIGRH